MFRIGTSDAFNYTPIASDASLSNVYAEPPVGATYDRTLKRLEDVLSQLRPSDGTVPKFLTTYVTFLELVVSGKLPSDFLPFTLFADAVDLASAKIYDYSPRKPSRDCVLFFGLYLYYTLFSIQVYKYAGPDVVINFPRSI